MLDIIFAGYRNLDRRLMALEGSKEGEMDRIRRMVLNTPIPISKSEILALMPGVSTTIAEAVLGGMARDGSVRRIGGNRNARYVGTFQDR